MNHFDNNNDYSLPGLYTDEQIQNNAIWPPLQIRQEVEQSVKGVIEYSIPPLVEEAVRKQSHASIPILVEGIKRELQASIPALIDEAVKKEFRAAIPLLVESLKKEIHSSITTMVEVTLKKEVQALIPVQGTHRIAPVCPTLLVNSTLPSTSRSSPQQEESSASRGLHLYLLGSVPDEIFTMNNLKDQDVSLEVELRDKSERRVVSGPESSAKIKLSVISGDLNIEDGYTEEEINKHVVSPRKDKAPLLKGKYEIILSRGVANVSEIAFTDNSSSTRSKTFRLGAQVVKDVSPGVPIKGVVSDAFRVKERRTMFNRKNNALTPEDDVRYLVNIGNGITRNKLAGFGVHTVKEFLQFNDDNPAALREIFRGDSKLKQTLEMARTSLSIQPPQIINNSRKRSADTSRSAAYGNLSVLTISSALSKTLLQAENGSPSTLQDDMELPDSTTAEQDEKEKQADGFILASCEEPGLNSTYTPSEKQRELPILDSTTTQIPAGVRPYYSDLAEFSKFGDLSVEDYDYYDGSPSSSPFVQVSEDKLAAKSYSVRWRPILAALKFTFALKVSVRDSPRAQKRQKFSSDFATAQV